MSSSKCGPIRRALARGSSVPGVERHLFFCPNCRARVRLGQAWKGLPRPQEQERLEPADEAFVVRVLDLIRQDRRRRSRLHAGLAAAAALLFFFLAGAAGQIAATATDSGDDAYAQLIGPSDSDLDVLLPQ